jgi:hypothetical protein
MKNFVQRHASSVIGTLSGFDRLLFRGTLRRIANAGGLSSFLSYTGVLLKAFADHSMALTEQVKAASLGVAEEAGRPVEYLPDASVRKEDRARAIARRDGINEGLVCVLKAVEPCWSYEIHRNAGSRRLELRSRPRRCLHLYHYTMHPRLGLCHARVQTWLPFNVTACVNGREWLARQMDAAGIGYRRRENCFTDLSDVAAAQALMDRQLTTDWRPLLDGLAAAANPAHAALFGPASGYPIDHYWSAQQSEWATDVMFRSRTALSALYPRLIRQGMQALGSRDVLRFLGKRVPDGQTARAGFGGEVLSDLKDRPEGMRVKHAVNGNSVKMYDKQGSVLRVETTINQPREFTVFRGTEEKPQKRQWRKMRKGVADLHRRAEVSQASNERYLASMAAVEATASVGQSLRPVCRPVSWNGKQARALRPFDAEEMTLLAAVGRGEFAINGFRNRDVRAMVCGPDDKADPASMRRRSGQVTRKLRLLRAHGLIRKVPRTHRYMLSDKGTTLVTLLMAAKDADVKRLSAAA